MPLLSSLNLTDGSDDSRKKHVLLASLGNVITPIRYRNRTATYTEPGRCALARGDTATAIAQLRQALKIFQRLGVAEVTQLAPTLQTGDRGLSITVPVRQLLSWLGAISCCVLVRCFCAVCAVALPLVSCHRLQQLKFPAGVASTCKRLTKTHRDHREYPVRRITDTALAWLLSPRPCVSRILTPAPGVWRAPSSDRPPSAHRSAPETSPARRVAPPR